MSENASLLFTRAKPEGKQGILTTENYQSKIEVRSWKSGAEIKNR